MTIFFPVLGERNTSELATAHYGIHENKYLEYLIGSLKQRERVKPNQTRTDSSSSNSQKSNGQTKHCPKPCCRDKVKAYLAATSSKNKSKKYQSKHRVNSESKSNSHRTKNPKEPLKDKQTANLEPSEEGSGSNVENFIFDLVSTSSKTTKERNNEKPAKNLKEQSSKSKASKQK